MLHMVLQYFKEFISFKNQFSHAQKLPSFTQGIKTFNIINIFKAFFRFSRFLDDFKIRIIPRQRVLIFSSVEQINIYKMVMYVMIHNHF